MPRADSYISGLFAGGASKAAVRSRVLTALEAAAIVNALRADAADYYYSAWISYLDALRGIDRGFFTWSKVKLYYSLFYAFRASLALDDFCIFHVGRSHYTVFVSAGGAPVSCTDPGTHKAVMRAFQRQNPNHSLLSQQIDLQDAIDWFIEQREKANYGQARFSEPDCDSEFYYIVENGGRKTINGYIEEPSTMYVFDPDHAMVAYPLRALSLIGDLMLAAGVATPNDEEQTFLASSARDRAGSLSSILREMKRVGMTQ
jgi:uncharacterized protein (UPF0332 family)